MMKKAILLIALFTFSLGYSQSRLNAKTEGTKNDSIVLVSSAKKTYHVPLTDLKTWIGSGDSSPLTTKGDINVFSTINDRLPVGIDGKVLTADSSDPTGLSWETSTTGVTDHTLLSNIGTNTHAQIDTHIADGTIHFTQGAISITESQISDLGSYVDLTTNQSVGGVKTFTTNLGLEVDNKFIYDKDEDSFAYITSDFSNVYGYGVGESVYASANNHHFIEGDNETYSDVYANEFKAQDGTVTTPTYSFTDDEDTGMYRTTNTLRFATNGADRLTLGVGLIDLKEDVFMTGSEIDMNGKTITDVGILGITGTATSTQSIASIISGGDTSIINKRYLDPYETTATALDLSNLNGNLVSMSSANSATTYTISSSVANGYAQVLINTTSEPTVTGATKTEGATWVTGTDMYLVVWNNGNRSEFYFLER